MAGTLNRPLSQPAELLGETLQQTAKMVGESVDQSVQWIAESVEQSAKAVVRPLHQTAQCIFRTTQQSAAMVGRPLQQSAEQIGSPVVNYACVAAAPLLPLFQLLQFALVVIWSYVTWQLEAFQVAYFLFTFIGTPFVSIFLCAVLLFFPPLWPLAVLYAVWFVYDFRTPEQGGRTIEYLRSPKFWKRFVDYFPIELVKTADLSPEHNYIIASHPHGIYSIGAVASLAWNATGWLEKFPGISTRLATLDGQFWYPFRREYNYFTGAISCSKASFMNVLGSGKGKAFGIVVGGAQEILDAHPGNYHLTLLTRKGFIKMALATGAHLVPMYHFGETDVFYTLPNERGSLFRTVQKFMIRYMGFPLTIAAGRGIFTFFGFLPFRSPIHSVVGRPIAVVKTPNPTAKEIDELHTRYCTELRQLFEAHKQKYGIARDVHLQFC